MKKKLATITILTLFTYLFVCSNIVYATSENSSLEELLPSSEDISHGFQNKQLQNVTLNEDGFREGISVNYNVTLDDHAIMELHIKIYKFSGTETAFNYYNKTITEIESTQIYDEVEIPSAFAIITFEDADVGTSWLISDNIVTNVEVVNDYTFEDTEEMLTYYTQLELDIIPEFQSWILISIYVISTISVIIIKKKTLTQ